MYDETVDLRSKAITLIGTDKRKCIIQRRTEDYYTPPIWMTNSIVENFTLLALRKTEMTDEEIWNTSTANTSSGEENKVRGNYCIHLDADRRGSSAIRKPIIHNCVLISECNDCIGTGAYPDEEIEISDCYIINKSGYRGFAIHVNTNVGYDGTCYILLKNNIFLSYHKYCLFFTYYTENPTPPKSILNTTFINNRTLSKDGSSEFGKTNVSLSYDFFVKNELSYGNSNSELNL